MQLIVFEDSGFVDLLPLAYPRATFNLRCGCDNLLSKIEAAVGRQADALFVRPMLAEVMAERQRMQYPSPRTVNIVPDGDDQLWINGRVLWRRMPVIEKGQAAWSGETLLAARVDRDGAAVLAAALTKTNGPSRGLHVPASRTKNREGIPGSMGARRDSRTSGSALFSRKPKAHGEDALRKACDSLTRVEIAESDATVVSYPWHLVHANETELRRQITAMTRQREGNIHRGAHLVNENDIHISDGAVVKPGTVLDAEPGPIYIGEGATVGPNATVIGPCYIGDKCLIRPGAMIVGSSIGPVCKVGGEVEGTIIHAYSNKQHDGFLGHSYVGEWVNLGADTVNSDLKNTYGAVSVPVNGRPVDTGKQFVGAFIGDHTKTGIRTAMPTGCIIGYGCSVFVGGYVPKFVPSFSWLTEDGHAKQNIEKMIGVARTVMARRGRELTAAEEGLLRGIHASATDVETAKKPKAKSRKSKSRKVEKSKQRRVEKTKSRRHTGVKARRPRRGI